MNILIVGSGKGSFQMRAVQLGKAIGARVTSAPTAKDWKWAELVVLVKRFGLQWAADVHRHGLPLVWDALDFWAQPAENHLNEAQAKAALVRQMTQIRPMLTIGATEAQAVASGGVYVPHHSWKGLSPTLARERVQTVAYEGGEVYLGAWRRVIERECKARGWRFILNPVSTMATPSPLDLSTVDILVSFRDGSRDGWICREWKSGVKAVNAIAAGRPFISQDSAAVRELQPAGSIVERVEELSAAFDWWADADRRAAVVAASLVKAPAFTLDTIAAQYLEVLESLVQTCTA